jgi:heme-degrading monooxygenase HmoA
MSMNVADKNRPKSTASADDVKDFVSGNWQVTKGKEAEFVRKWTEFLEWSKDASPGFVKAILIQDVADPNHYISMGYWGSEEERRAWQSNPTFAEKLGACRALCDDFKSGSYRLTVAVGD